MKFQARFKGWKCLDGTKDKEDEANLEDEDSGAVVALSGHLDGDKV